MDYSTYTRAAAIPLANEMDMVFLKGGPEQSRSYALQNSFFTEFIANPTEYADSSNLGIIRTQYMAQRAVLDPKDVQSDKPSGYVMMFDASLVKYLKADTKGNIAYTNILKKDRTPNPLQQIGIKTEDINYLKDENGENEIAYFVLATQKFQKDGVKVVRIGTDNYDRLVNLGGMYITALDMVVDKTQFEKTMESTGKNKVDFPIMTGWADSNPKGWTIFESKFDSDFVIPKGQEITVDTTVEPEGEHILLQVGDPDDSIIRRPQGYYNGLTAQPTGVDQGKKGTVTGQYTYTLREGATVKNGDKVRVFLPDTATHDQPVSIYRLISGTERDQGQAVLSLGEECLGKNKKRVLTTHIYKDYKTDRGYYKVRYTPKGKTEEASFEFRIVNGLAGTVHWEGTDESLIIGTPNRAVTAPQGNFKIDLSKVEPATDLIIESYNSKDELQEDEIAGMDFTRLNKSAERYTRPAWLDSTDNLSLITLKKSVYRPYQEVYTNNYAMSEDGLENADKINQIYRDPRSIPATAAEFMTDTQKVEGFTRYDGGSVRMLYVNEGGVQYVTKTHAAENEYDDEGELVGEDVRKNVKVENKKYQAFPYELDLKGFDEVRSTPISGTTFKLYKDMRLMVNTSDGSSIPSDWLETKVKTRVLFDATEGNFAENKKQEVKIVPDNVKFYDEDGYTVNGFTGANVAAGTGDKFPTAPTATGKTFLGWVTEAGLTKLGIDKTKADANYVTTADKFEKLTANTEKFTAETPVERHLVVYAVWSTEKLVTFDANGGKFEDETTTKGVKTNDDKTVTAPKDPTREGYTFKGWASKADATEAEDGILANITDAKTVYAVWEQAQEESAKPTITEPKAGDTSVSGTGVAGATVVLKDKDGNKIGEAKVDKDGNWKVENIPADKLVEGEKVTAEQTEKGKKPATEEATVAKAQEEPQPGKTTIDESGKKAVNPTDEKQGTGVKVTNKDDGTKISAKDEDGNEIPAVINPTTGEIEVTPGINVDGPITVTVEDPDLDGGKKDITIDVNGHQAGKDDNNNGTPDPNATSVDDSNVQPVNPTDDSQNTGIVVTNSDDDTKVSAKDEDGNNVPASIDENGNVIVKPGTNVDGPIIVTVEDPELRDGKKVIEVPVNGHEKGRDDNRSDKGNSGGYWIIPSTPSKTDDKPKHENAIHKAYIFGYEDSTFRPEGDMTRAEAAAMLARLQGLDLSNSARPNFMDVRSGWYNAAINAAVDAGYMKGYPDGTFRPNGKITRAEFAQMIKAIDKANTGMAPFADAKGHWAEAAINQAYANARISGYPDGTFRPNNHITRAEAVTVFNKLYDRSVGEAGLADVKGRLVEFNDINRSHWAYFQVVEASNTHEFYRTEKGKVDETWVRVLQTWKEALENR